MVAAWGESSDEDSEDEDGDEKALMAIGESDEEFEVSINEKENPMDFIDESEDLNNEKEQLSKECVILKAKCKNLELRASESESKNAELKNQVHKLDTTILELRSENLKLKSGTGKKKADHTQLTLEENVRKIKDELYKRDEQIRVLKEDLNKVKHELDRTCKWNRSSDALSWLHEHHSSNKRGLGYETPGPKSDPKSKYLTLPENIICTHCDKTGHYLQKKRLAKRIKNLFKEKIGCWGNSLIWYIDSGCSKHITGNKNQFLSFEDLKIGNVTFGNGKKGEIIGVGKRKRVNNTYIVDLSTLSENELTFLSVLDNDPLFWHMRLGHASLSQLNKLVSKDLVIGLPNIKFKKEKVCEAWCKGEAGKILF
ncbi:uncharacterized protein [Nicotiana sylvestris]|uniref:uncharacterized protein n=1 Tax=Nicotiana sylvestris TaxID=4096 RepID=UPI00388CB6F6